MYPLETLFGLLYNREKIKNIVRFFLVAVHVYLRGLWHVWLSDQFIPWIYFILWIKFVFIN